MIIGPHFDESLAALRELREPLLACVVLAFATAFALANVVVRRARARWILTRPIATGSPYRRATVFDASPHEVPWLLRATATSCFAFGHLFVPALLVALTTLRFDGIAVPLIPGVAIALGTWACGWLLLLRARATREIVRASAVISLVLHVSMLALSLAHLALVEGESPVHECSSSFAFVTLVFASCAVAQAALMLAALRRHRPMFDRVYVEAGIEPQ